MDSGGYFHPLFLRNRPDLLPIIYRTHIKDCNRFIAPEPNLYAYPSCNTVPACTPISSDESNTAAVDQEEEDDDDEDNKPAWWSSWLDSLEVIPTSAIHVTLGNSKPHVVKDNDDEPASFAGQNFHCLEDMLMHSLESRLLATKTP